MKHWIIWVSVALLTGQAVAEDWPIWRGPTQDGISTETGWNAESASIKWQKALGDGYSTVSVHGDKVYTAGHVDGKDIVYCLNAQNGDELWRYEYPCSTGSFKGPRATPVPDGDHLYMVSQDGEAYCLNIEDGSLKWKTDVLKASGNEKNRFGMATSAIIEGDLILLNIGAHGTALNKNTGDVVWKSKGAQSYASPVVAEFKNTKYAFVFAAQSVEMVEVESGKPFTSYAWETQFGVNGADPLLLDGNRVFITTGYDKGCVLLDYSSGKLEKVWENELIASQFSSCVYLDGYIYGVDGDTKKKGFLRCISASDGTEQWNMPIGFGSLMVADGKIIALGERGTLYVAKAIPEKYEEIAQFDTGLGQLCWTAPVLANGTIYCRNDKGTLVAVDVSK